MGTSLIDTKTMLRNLYRETRCRFKVIMPSLVVESDFIRWMDNIKQYIFIYITNVVLFNIFILQIMFLYIFIYFTDHVLIYIFYRSCSYTYFFILQIMFFCFSFLKHMMTDDFSIQKKKRYNWLFEFIQMNKTFKQTNWQF